MSHLYDPALRATPTPPLTSPGSTNVTPASSRTRCSFNRLSVLILVMPSTLLARRIVLSLTPDCAARAASDHLSSALPARICEPVSTRGRNARAAASQHIPRVIGSPDRTLVRLLDEYHWIAIIRRHETPTPEELKQWVGWASPQRRCQQ